MKIVMMILLCLLGYSSYAQENKAYDKALAEKLGGDEYGMKMYTLVILKTGSNKIEDKKITDSLFRGHMNNIDRLVKMNKMIVAGPLKKNYKNYRGIFILNATTTEEANALLATDPAISSKMLEAEIYGWYGSAALPEYLPYHNKIEQKSH